MEEISGKGKENLVLSSQPMQPGCFFYVNFAQGTEFFLTQFMRSYGFCSKCKSWAKLFRTVSMQ